MSMINGMVFAAALGGALAFSGGSAFAAIACVGDECWHAHEHYEYPAQARVVVHPDEWKWKSDEHFRWHEHEGRGYWAGGEWKDF